MVWSFKLVKHGIAAGLLIAFFLTGCATSQISPASNIETADGAFSVPYRISSSGRFLIDVSINDGPSRPLSVDTGATVSVIYDDFARAEDLNVSERTIFVRGLVGQGDRPVIEGVSFRIADTNFPLSQVVMLEMPSIQDEAVGLLGGDILSGYIVLFDHSVGIATFVPRENVDKKTFAGWNQISLRTLRDSDTKLYFAETVYGDVEIPVLVDTGSNLNFINWKLATMDENIRRIERDMLRNGTLQGALDTTSAIFETVFYDLELDDQSWDELPVFVTGLDGLATIAPVDEPIMVAGANLFTPLTIAFDLEGLSLYVFPSEEE
ncbi:MAG: aspartyl protease family protein [Litorimonas sp.]